MKKFRIVLLILVLLLGAVTIFIATNPDVIVNLLSPKDEETEESSPAVELGELSIELPDDLDYISTKSSPNYNVYSGNGYRVDIERVYHSSITPNPGYSFPSLQEFMKLNLSMMLASGDESDLQFTTVDGISCVEADTDGDGNPDTFVAIFETEDAFWDIRFSSYSEDYETARDQFVAWAKTVTFSK